MSPFPAGEVKSDIFEMFTWKDLHDAGVYVNKHHKYSHELVESRIAFNLFKKLNKSPMAYKNQQDVANALKVITPDRVNSSVPQDDAKTYLGNDFCKTAKLGRSTFYEDLDMILRNVFQKIWNFVVRWKKNPRMVKLN